MFCLSSGVGARWRPFSPCSESVFTAFGHERHLQTSWCHQVNFYMALVTESLNSFVHVRVHPSHLPVTVCSHPPIYNGREVKLVTHSWSTGLHENIRIIDVFWKNLAKAFPSSYVASYGPHPMQSPIWVARQVADMVGVGTTKNIYTAAIHRNHAVRRCERSSCQAVQVLNEGWAQFTNQASGTFQVLVNSILNVLVGVLGTEDGCYPGIRAGGCHQGLNSLSSAHSLLSSHASGAQF